MSTIKNNIKLNEMVDSKIESWDQSAINNMSIYLQKNQVARCILIKYPRVWRFKVVLNDGFELECSHTGYKLLKENNLINIEIELLRVTCDHGIG